MAILQVQYEKQCAVLIDGEARGRTNSDIPIEPGSYRIEVDDDPIDPEFQQVVVDAESGAHDTIGIRFTMDPNRDFDRFDSRLYCGYNGFMLGQFVSLFRLGALKGDYPVRRARMQEFLDEIGVDLTVPEWRHRMDEGDDGFDGALESALREASPRLSLFCGLGTMLTEFPLALAAQDPDRLAVVQRTIRSFTELSRLPQPDLERFKPVKNDAGDILVNSIVEPGLQYLEGLLQKVSIEKKTAFVAMPFSPPFASRFAAFYRPVLERAGYRAIRAWGGLAEERYDGVMITLIRKCGGFLADVSCERTGPRAGHPNPNVLYEIGVRHASEGRAWIFADKDDLKPLPANIGHDVVHSYDCENGELSALAISAAVPHLHIGPFTGNVRPTAEEQIAATERLGEWAKERLFGESSRAAADRGSALLEEGDHDGAIRQLTEAIELGNDGTSERLRRTAAYFSVDRFAEARDDLDELLSREDLDSVADPDGPGLRAGCHYYRSLARQELGDSAGAEHDLAEARRLGFVEGATGP